MCSNIRVFYREFDFWDAIGFGVWTENVEYDFICRTNRFANDKVRVIFGIENKPGEAKGRFFNSNPEDAAKIDGVLSKNDTELTKMNFKVSNTFRQYFTSTFSEELNGLKTFQFCFFTKRWKDHTAYNGWNFTDHFLWDSPFPEDKSFWFDNENRFLYKTMTFEIGS